jgi:hypothetical protein
VELALFRVGLGVELSPAYVVADTPENAIAKAIADAGVGPEQVTGADEVARPVVIA